MVYKNDRVSVATLSEDGLASETKINHGTFRVYLARPMDDKKTSTHALRNCSAGGNAGKSKSPDDQLDSHEDKRSKLCQHTNVERRCCHSNKNHVRKRFLEKCTSLYRRYIETLFTVRIRTRF
jgi:hypothetical protein